MSEVSRSLFRLGDQFRRGFREQGQDYLNVAELGLKEAGLKRQSMLDEIGRPAREWQKQQAERKLGQAEQMDAPFNAGNLITGMGSLEMATAKDKSGKPGMTRIGRFAFNASYSPEENTFVKTDGTPITNREAMEAAPRIQEWFTMNFSPYRGMRVMRDEGLIKSQGLDPADLKAKELKKQARFGQRAMKNPAWKFQALQKLRSYISRIPEDPYGEKKNNLERIDKQMAIVRKERDAFIKREQELTDKETKRTQELEDEISKRKFEIKKLREKSDLKRFAKDSERQHELEKEIDKRKHELKKLKKEYGYKKDVARITAGKKKDITRYQNSQLRARAMNIVNKEIENKARVYAEDWTDMTPEQQEAWKSNRFEEVYKTLLPPQKSPTYGLGLFSPSKQKKSMRKSSGKTVVRRQRNRRTGEIKTTYSDGTSDSTYGTAAGGGP